MRSLMIVALAGAGAALAAPALAAPRLTDAQKLDRDLAGRTAGKPESCVTLNNVQSTSLYSNPDVILYKMRSGARYLNRPAGGCNFRSDPILVTQTPSTRLCRGDIVQLIDRTSRFPMGACGLGDFVPYTRAK